MIWFRASQGCTRKWLEVKYSSPPQECHGWRVKTRWISGKTKCWMLWTCVNNQSTIVGVAGVDVGEVEWTSVEDWSSAAWHRNTNRVQKQAYTAVFIHGLCSWKLLTRRYNNQREFTTTFEGFNEKKTRNARRDSNPLHSLQGCVGCSLSREWGNICCFSKVKTSLQKVGIAQKSHIVFFFFAFFKGPMYANE